MPQPASERQRDEAWLDEVVVNDRTAHKMLNDMPEVTLGKMLELHGVAGLATFLYFECMQKYKGCITENSEIAASWHLIGRKFQDIGKNAEFKGM